MRVESLVFIAIFVTILGTSSAQFIRGCKVLKANDFEVSWALNLDEGSVAFTYHMRNSNAAKYYAFGASKNQNMASSDLVVAWYNDVDAEWRLDDFSIGATRKCSTPTGMCKDAKGIASGVIWEGDGEVKTARYKTYLMRTVNDPQDFDWGIMSSQQIAWGIGTTAGDDFEQFSENGPGYITLSDDYWPCTIAIRPLGGIELEPETPPLATPTPPIVGCQSLHADTFELEWVYWPTQQTVDFTYIMRTDDKARYFAFGASQNALMTESDVLMAWYGDLSKKWWFGDFSVTGKHACNDDNVGVCPDSNQLEDYEFGTTRGYPSITFTIPIDRSTIDATDYDWDTNDQQYVWAYGDVKNDKGQYHTNRGAGSLNLTSGSWNCNMLQNTTTAVPATTTTRSPPQWRSFHHAMPSKTGFFSAPMYGISGNISYVDYKTLILTNFVYNGKAPSLYFHVVTNKTNEPLKIYRLQSEGEMPGMVRKYDGDCVVLKLPTNVALNDLAWFALYSETDQANLVSVGINRTITPRIELPKQCVSRPYKLRDCLQLTPQVKVAWGKTDNGRLLFEVRAYVEPDDYIAFGLSGSIFSVNYFNSDVVALYVDNGAVVARDISVVMNEGSCNVTNGTGVCFDDEIGLWNDASVMWSDYTDGLLRVAYSKPIIAPQNSGDLNWNSMEDRAIFWEIGKMVDGQLNLTMIRVNETRRIFFTRSSNILPGECADAITPLEPLEPWSDLPAFDDEHRFLVAMGPNGGRQGYRAIANATESTWAEVFYVNYALAPRLTVRRGHRYSFIVLTGDDVPFYVTSDSQGGIDINRREQTVFVEEPAKKRGNFKCLLSQQDRKVDAALFDSFGDYFASLKMYCDVLKGKASMLEWKVADDTPDTVYYQCRNRVNIGFEISVTD